MSHNLAIITVVYENYSLLHDFLKSLDKQQIQNFHLYIVDNSVHKQNISELSVPHTVILSKNNGYADAVNEGLEAAVKDGKELFCILNYDTFFGTEFTKNIETALTAHPGSIIGGKIYYAPGYEYHKDRYTYEEKGNIIWYAGGEIDWNHAVTPHTGVDEVDKGQFNTAKQITFVTGCLMCYDKKVLDKNGKWDSSYFLYYEDADFCARALRKNISLFYEPTIVLWHKVSQVTEGSGSKFQQKFQDKNRLKFGLKYAPLRTKLHLIKNAVLHT